jgi:DNA topoisomerase VI subunit A
MLMTEENQKVRVVVIDDSSINAASLAKLLLSKGIDCQIITVDEYDALEHKKLKEHFSFDVDDLNHQLTNPVYQDNHCWWQQFEKKKKNKHTR